MGLCVCAFCQTRIKNLGMRESRLVQNRTVCNELEQTTGHCVCRVLCVCLYRPKGELRKHNIF